MRLAHPDDLPDAREIPADRFTRHECDDGSWIVCDALGAFGGQAVVLPDRAAMWRHCNNIITDERERVRDTATARSTDRARQTELRAARHAREQECRPS